MTAPAKEKASGAKYIAEPLVALDGGPRHAWWYTLADWNLLRASAERVPADVQRDVLGYQPTTEQRANPDGVNTGTVWRHPDGLGAGPTRGGRR